MQNHRSLSKCRIKKMREKVGEKTHIGITKEI